MRVKKCCSTRNTGYPMLLYFIKIPFSLELSRKEVERLPNNAKSVDNAPAKKNLTIVKDRRLSRRDGALLFIEYNVDPIVS